MHKAIVRGVDWGNIQRSPTFEAVFSKHTSETKHPFPIVFDSGGIMVEKILANLSPVKVKLSIIDTGLVYGILPEDIKQTAQELVDECRDIEDDMIFDNIKRSITGVYAQVKDLVHTKQMDFRNKALIEAGILEDSLPGMRVPYKHHSDLKLVLALDQIVVTKLEEYYQALEQKEDITRPLIKIYGNLVSREPLKDIHTGGMETARNQVKYFLETQDSAMKKIIETLQKDHTE